MRIVDLEIIGHTIKEIENNVGKIIRRIRFTKEESEIWDNHIEKLYKEDEVPAGEVIAEGIVESDSTTCKSLRDFVSNIDGFTSLPIKENLKGKKVQIIIREVTD